MPPTDYRYPFLGARRDGRRAPEADTRRRRSLLALAVTGIDESRPTLSVRAWCRLWQARSDEELPALLTAR